MFLENGVSDIDDLIPAVLLGFDYLFEARRLGRVFVHNWALPGGSEQYEVRFGNRPEITLGLIKLQE